jgi:glycosyltransferase involved in cell wall biosynthesis
MNTQLPRISIITPSFNQAKYLERTIQSVVGQGYPNLEYIIIDGGSTDQSVEIISNHKNEISYWVSEPDNGQGHALNKGFRRASGDIVGWLNSDDLYLPGSLEFVGRFFQSNPQCDVLYGSIDVIDASDKKINSYWATTAQPAYTLWVAHDVHQQALFWRRSSAKKLGWLDENLRFAMDTDWVIRLLTQLKVVNTSRFLGTFRHHPETKTSTISSIGKAEYKLLRDRYRHAIPEPTFFMKLALRMGRFAQISLKGFAGIAYLSYKIGNRLGLDASYLRRFFSR